MLCSWWLRRLQVGVGVRGQQWWTQPPREIGPSSWRPISKCHLLQQAFPDALIKEAVPILIPNPRSENTGTPAPHLSGGPALPVSPLSTD